MTKGLGGAPRIVSVIPLAQDGDAWRAVQRLEEMGEEEGLKVMGGMSCQEGKRTGNGRIELE